MFGTWYGRWGPGSGGGSGRSSVCRCCSAVAPFVLTDSGPPRGEDTGAAGPSLQALVGDARGGPDTAPATARTAGRRHGKDKTGRRLGDQSGSFCDPVQRLLS